MSKLRIFREVEPVDMQTSASKCSCDCSRERLEYEDWCAKCLNGNHVQHEAQVTSLSKHRHDR